MNDERWRKITRLVAAGGMILLIPVGCGGQNDPVEVDLKVDNTPIKREEVAVVHSYAGVLKAVEPTVVSVYSQRTVDQSGILQHPGLRRFFGEENVPRERVERGVGSGVIVSPQGYVITNNHVVEDAEQIVVKLASGGEVATEIIGRDPATDIAILRIQNGNEELPYAVLADSDLIEVGDVVFALGNALGIGHSVTSGIISARGRTGIGILGEEGYEDFIQTDASMNIGNSGGPLVDSWGRVVGINTAIASPGGGNVGIGFAIPINMAREVMHSLLEHGEVRRGYLGLTLQDGDVDFVRQYGAPDRGGREIPNDGVLVVNVVEASPAEKAGLERGDVIVEMNGEKVGSASDLRLKVAGLGPGRVVDLGIIRDDVRAEVSAQLGNLKEVELREEPTFEVRGPEDELLPGVAVAPLTPEIRESFELDDDFDGLLVIGVADASPYSELLPEGSLILQVNDEPAEDIQVAREALVPGRNTILLIRDGSFHYLVIEVEED